MAKGFLVSGWLLRVLDANGDPPGSAFPFQVAFFDASTQTPATVYNDVECAIALGPVVALDAEGYVPDGGVWGEVGRSYKAVVSRVLSSDPELPDSERLEVLYTLNGIGDAEEPAVPEGSGVSVSGMAALRLIVPPDDGLLYFLSGYYAANDGGQGWFRWHAGSYEVDDGGYAVRPDSVSSGEAGRFIRVLGSELDVRWWGAIPDGVVDCAAPLMRCKAHAARIDLYAAPPRIAFPAGASYYSIPGSVVLGGADGRGYAHSWRVKDGARFGGFTTMRIESDAIIESTTFFDVGGQRRVEIAPEACRRVDLRWWGGAASTTDDLYHVAVGYAPGLPVYVDASCCSGGALGFTSSVTIPARVVVGKGAMLRVSASAVVTLDSVECDGPARQVLATDGTGAFAFSGMRFLDAWLCGWGSSPGSNTAALFAARCANASTVGIVCRVNGAGVDGFSAPVLSDAVDFNTPLLFDGVASVASGGRFTCTAVTNWPGSPVLDSVHDFPLSVDDGRAHATWFGASGFGVVRKAINAVSGSAAGYGRSIDLDGRSWACTDAAPAVVDSDNVTLVNGRLAAYAGAYNLVECYGATFRAENVEFYGMGGFAGSLLVLQPWTADAKARERRGFLVRGCRFSCPGGRGLQIGGNREDKATGRVQVDGCAFTMTGAVAVPFHIVNGAEFVEFSGCEFSGLVRQASDWTLYGRNVSIQDCKFTNSGTAAAALRWEGSSGFRFVRNRADMLGVLLFAFADVVVSDNRFTTQAVVWLACRYHGQKFDGVVIEHNTFELTSRAEWGRAVHVWQSYTLDGNAVATPITAFDWSPSTLKLRIRKNSVSAPNNPTGSPTLAHQTEFDWIADTDNASSLFAVQGLIPFSYVLSTGWAFEHTNVRSYDASDFLVSWKETPVDSGSKTYIRVVFVPTADNGCLRAGKSAGRAVGTIRCSNY